MLGWLLVVCVVRVWFLPRLGRRRPLLLLHMYVCGCGGGAFAGGNLAHLVTCCHTTHVMCSKTEDVTGCVRTQVHAASLAARQQHPAWVARCSMRRCVQGFDPGVELGVELGW